MSTRGTWSFYSENTGQFNGTQFTGPQAMLTANTPAGLLAIEGAFDAAVQQVDLDSLAVVTRIPTAPEATELCTWVWHEVLRQHVPEPTFEGLRRDLVLRIRRLIKETEGPIDRALRDLVLGGPPGPSRDRLQHIEDLVQPLRSAIEAAEAAGTPADLAEIDIQVFPTES